jgi:Trk-type K+ transport system membrane component
MNLTEAAKVIDEIINSIKDNPAQFQLSINVIGQQVTSHGGTGMSISVTGGGPGSTTIGNKVTVGGASVEIAQQRGKQAMNEQFNALLNTLNAISEQLKVREPDKSLIQRLTSSLKNTWVPGVIVGVVSNVVTAALGM